jgi:hypothetical protein
VVAVPEPALCRAGIDDTLRLELAPQRVGRQSSPVENDEIEGDSLALPQGTERGFNAPRIGDSRGEKSDEDLLASALYVQVPGSPHALERLF